MDDITFAILAASISSVGSIIGFGWTIRDLIKYHVYELRHVAMLQVTLIWSFIPGYLWLWLIVRFIWGPDYAHITGQ